MIYAKIYAKVNGVLTENGLMKKMKREKYLTLNILLKPVL